MKRIIIHGATSAIAQAFGRLCAKHGVRVVLIGRNETRLRMVADDLRARGAQSAEVCVTPPGVADSSIHAVREAFKLLGGCDFFLSAQGLLPVQADCEATPELLAETLRVTTTDVMQAALAAATCFEEQPRGGVLAVIGSVAGDRGRRGNYVYGAAKAALDVFCDGLRQRLAPRTAVVLIKPGPVDTPMTAHLARTPLFSTPEAVAADILKAMLKRKAVVYAPGRWRWIMLIVRLLPARIVAKMKA